MTDSCLRAESQNSLCQAFLSWEWVVLPFRGVCSPCSSPASIKWQLKEQHWRVGAGSSWNHPFADPEELLGGTRAPLLKLEPGVLLPTAGRVSWMSSSRLVGARSLLGAGSEELSSEDNGANIAALSMMAC